MDINNPLEAIYAFAEQTYIRMQAGDLLMRCIDSGSIRPMQELVEGLVLAGPQSMNTLNEIVLETGQRRAQVQDDLQRLYGEFQKKLSKRKRRASDQLPDAITFTQMDEDTFYKLLVLQGITAEDEQTDCFQLFQETQDLMSSLVENIQLFIEIENILRDWLWALAYQSAHEARPVINKTSTDWQL